jgi:hypothetical protein
MRTGRTTLGLIGPLRYQKNDSRPLSAGEIALARLIFGDSIDYSRVKIHRRGYLWLGLQRADVAMAPNGEIYFGRKCFKNDFSRENASSRHWFIHEMTHVWQHQLGYPVKWRGAIRIGLNYRYILEPNRKLGNFNMEAQGDLLADYFALRFLREPRVMARPEYRDDIALYEQVLRDFLENPASRANLPHRRVFAV